ncbi:hypothetical protein GLAREA_00988 [Glarea lozoyensis ATCC 20868]|uniref:Mid2 domain-containing protein n=1 Tax=Glarea lozoyensis (strain ATCC 20868 / MF5171) TaxID=1116229 RepID=S3DTX1_GLAL2|nr:uncharacterized protein GLAREA_00988 [Glarea lozoyensis ATCC 20868]EPE29828.1 hypothetical protein GLAREA_00988 [Glarea lozoyensis ATCC 20868]
MRGFDSIASLIVSLTLLTLPLAVAADPINTNGVNFLYPPPGLTPKYLDTIKATWTSLFQAPYLYTNCLNETGGTTVKKHYPVPTNGSSAVVLDFKNLSSCWFNLRPQDWYIPDSGSNSESFVVVPGMRQPYPQIWELEVQDPGQISSPATETAGDSPATLTILTPDATPNPSLTTTIVRGPATTLANTASSATSPAKPELDDHDHDQHGLGKGAKAGIGISVAAIIIGFAALAFFLLARRNQRREMAISNHVYETALPRPLLPIARVLSDTPSYSTTAPITPPCRAILEHIKNEEEGGTTPRIESVRSTTPRIESMRIESLASNSPRIESVMNGSLRQDSVRAESMVELSHADSALHELYSPAEVHEIGPGRWENTGFGFPPEKTARC